MYFIVNTLAREITIADIKLTLGPKQAIDLDRYIGRSKFQDSKNLQEAIRAKIIEVRSDTGLKKEEAPPPPQIIEKQVLDIDKLKEEIRKELRQELKEQFQSNPNDSAQILNAIRDLTSKVSAGVPVYKNQENGSEKTSGNDDIDEAILLKIHEKAAERMSKGVKESNVSSETQQVSGSLDHIASELEDLIG